MMIAVVMEVKWMEVRWMEVKWMEVKWIDMRWRSKWPNGLWWCARMNVS